MQAIGKFIDSSGIINILVDSGLIAQGSVKGFLSGTHFNRCKRLHPIVALGFKILHFKSFLESYNNGKHAARLELEEIIEVIQKDSETKSRDATVFELKDVLDRYDSFIEQTLNGEHGQTAKFILLYIRFVESYQLFERAIRTCDLEMYVYAAYQMCPLFFSVNHHNYARWLTKNVDDLMNIETTHPGLSNEFKNGALSIRRTPKSFCRSAIDITLEQTINANAANKLTGISAFTNSINARQRWAETHSLRTAIITELLQFLGLAKYSDSGSKYQTKMFNKQLIRFVRELGENINPFGEELNPNNLFNLSSGRAASEAITEFLLNIQSTGIQQMEQFINECRIDKNRFYRAIKRNKVNNFSVETNKNKSLRKRIDGTKAEKNILGHVICLALKKEIDVSMLLSFPLTTFPHSLAHPDGTMISTNQKAEVTAWFTSKLESHPSNNSIDFDVDVIDGFYFLNGLRESPEKYGDFAKFVLERICDTTAREIHIIFDKHQSPSPRDPDMKKSKELYENFSSNFSIKGKNQQRNSTLKKCLASNSFREEIINFLIRCWSDEEEIESILNKKRVFVAFGDKCHVFVSKSERGKEILVFANNHFEVESKVIFHVSKILATIIRIQTPNPDTILVYLLYHMQYWQHEKEIFIETGDVNRNTVQRINVRQIFKSLSPVFINALPAWHIFTGSRDEPAFYGKGKKTCLKTLEKDNASQIAFGNITSNIPFVKEDNIAAIEEFTCKLYNSKCKIVNEARVNIFENGYETMVKKGNDRIFKILNF